MSMYNVVWGSLNSMAYMLREAEQLRVYPSRDEYLRLERVEVGKVCRCGDCLCCAELKKERND